MHTFRRNFRPRITLNNLYTIFCKIIFARERIIFPIFFKILIQMKITKMKMRIKHKICSYFSGTASHKIDFTAFGLHSERPLAWELIVILFFIIFKDNLVSIPDTSSPTSSTPLRNLIDGNIMSPKFRRSNSENLAESPITSYRAK